MSKLDVVSSLLRSSARSAAARMSTTQLGTALRRAMHDMAPGRIVIRDDQLTRAVAQVNGVAAATVSSAHGRMRFHLSFDDASQLLMALVPCGMAFAPAGAKELFFTVEPAEAARDHRSRDVVSAVAGEIARALWRPVLTRAPRSEHGAFVTSDSERVIVDLRTVPEVRWALAQRLPKLMIEALRPRALLASDGGVTVQLAFDRLG
jgi:hypothetical protein